MRQHIQRLSHEITPGHRDLKIPRHYRYEAPWPSAQAEIRRLAAYKTPADKVVCVTRCCQTIMNLLSLASGILSVSIAGFKQCAFEGGETFLKKCPPPLRYSPALKVA